MNSLDLQKPPAETRVVVAMSGGVDSCVVAALLKGEGYDVVGVTLQLYNDRGAAGRKGTCCAGRDIGDARAVAAKLSIPHYVLDYEARFHDAVIAPFAASYAAGETPIPCAACNDKVKFTDLLETARSLGADALATGHYCVTKATASGRGLYRGVDPTRDQSYFLFGTTAEQLGFVRFPLGTLAKTRVREIARELGLVTADKPDSQDICFVPTGRYSNIVARLLPEVMTPGDIIDESGTVLGHHEGIVNFTVGQRRGLAIGGARDPLFVVRIDAQARQVVVGPREALRTTRLTLRDVNWLGERLSPSARRDGIALFVRTRSTQPPVAAHFTWNDTPTVSFPEATGAVAPGQACVFYESDADGARVLGGGTVTRTPATARNAELAEAS